MTANSSPAFGSQAAPKPTTILLVDHSAKARSLLGELLTKRLGCGTVLEAANGIEAWQIIEHRTVDAVIANRRLPKMSGLELLVKLRESEAFAKLPVLMILNSNDDEAVAKAVHLGVSDFLVKPFTPHDFVVKYRRLLLNEERRGLPRHQVASVRSKVSLMDKAIGSLCGTAVNLSMSGLLAKMQYSRNLAVYDKVDLRIQFFIGKDDDFSKTIQAQVVRVEWNIKPQERNTAYYAFAFSVERPDQKKFLEKVIQHLKTTLPPVIK
ncbi:MAG TPA: response regulator [Desulfurivibrionaceae bacterium]|nr:response regulator [Desulfurivibrionaceae bacterium]